MTLCPHCNKELRYPERARHNADAYSQSCVVATDCCGHGIRVTPLRSYRIAPYIGTANEDDWGVRFARTGAE